MISHFSGCTFLLAPNSVLSKCFHNELKKEGGGTERDRQSPKWAQKFPKGKLIPLGMHHQNTVLCQ